MACKPQGESPVVPGDDKELAKACAYIQGGGSAATGGEGGTLCVVDRLDDVTNPETGHAEEGTLRYAIELGGARVVIFRVSGTIHLKRELELTRGNITIAGQTAPGDGICIADYPLIIKDCENVIVRFLRVRLGNESLKKDPKTDYDAISVNNCKNVVLDHCTASWSVDECVSCYGNENFTLQYCFITESLRAAGHVKGPHGYGGIWGGKNATFHHNLIAHHDNRNPRFDHDYVRTNGYYGPVDFVNNVVYNWGGNSAYGGEGNGPAHQINFQNNYYKPGPASKSGVRARLLNPTTKCDNCNKSHPNDVTPGQFYVDGNILFGADNVTADNWKGVFPDDASKINLCKADKRWTLNQEFALQSAQEAYETVLSKGGCSFRRDALDEVMISDVRKGSYTHKGSNGSTNGLIDSQKDAGGWPELKSEAPAKDTDRDGMPDAWETAHGLNPLSPTDAREHTLVAAHTNLECYLCDIVKHLY